MTQGWLRRGAGRATVVLLCLLLQGCFLPRYPGCGADFENRPSGDDMVITLMLISEKAGYKQMAAVSLDAEGHSELLGEYTTWAFSAPIVCEEISREQVARIKAVWNQVNAIPLEVWGEYPRPHVAVAIRPGADEARFVVLPASQENNQDLLDAARLTSSVFVDAYGERLEREFRYAGLDSLLE